MSVNALTWSFKTPMRGLALKSVLHALADHADPVGRCWPSIDRLALYAGCDVKTVRKALRGLEGLGAIRRQARPGTSDMFELMLDWTPAGDVAPLPEVVPLPKAVVLPELAGVPLPKLVGHPSQSWEGNRQEPSDEPPVEPTAADEAFSLYVAAAKLHGWVVPRKLDPDRRKALQAILKEWGGLDSWRDALAKAGASDFIMGRTKRSDEHANWRCDLDFLLKPKRFRRLVEGGYGGSAAVRAVPQREAWAAQLP